MKTEIMFKLIFILFLGLSISCNSTKEQKREIPLAPEQYRRPKNLKLTDYKYSLEELKKKYSDEMMQRASMRMENIKSVIDSGQWKPTPESIDKHTAPEWYEDSKFGMFIDWGPWSVAGFADKKPMENDPSEEPRTYPDWYEFRMYSEFKDYHEKTWGDDFERDDFIPLFTASQYQPDKLVDIAVESGMKYIVPFSKHHGGFCLWPSSFTQRDAGDMGPQKDLIRPLIESCRKQGLKTGFYLCIGEWEYPVIDENNKIVKRIWSNGIRTEPYSKELEKKCSGKIPVKNYYNDYLIPLATEYIDTYDPDILWFDGEWKTEATDIHSYDIASYFYNKAQGRKEVVVNDRYGEADKKWLRWERGDFFTDESEGTKHSDKMSTHAWEENRGISTSYGFNWQDTDNSVISSKDFINLFVKVVSMGGNFLLITNLDGAGALPDIQEKRLKDIGRWLKVTGEAIYATRAYKSSSEGTVYFTRSKDYKKVYAIATEWPEKQLKLKSVTPKKGSKIFLLGAEEPLHWTFDKVQGITVVDLPEYLQEESKRPCNYAWAFRIEI